MGVKKLHMHSLLDYLSEMHKELSHSYEANCLAISRHVAGLLLDAGKQPVIVCLHKEEDRAEATFHYPLIPTKYNGRITWTKHYACCCDGIVYDPMLEEPIRVEQYSVATFGVEFPIEIYVAEEAMGEYLRRSHGYQRAV